MLSPKFRRRLIYVLLLGVVFIFACIGGGGGGGDVTPTPGPDVAATEAALATSVQNWLDNKAAAEATASVQAIFDANATDAQKFYDSGQKIPTYDPYAVTPTPIP